MNSSTRSSTLAAAVVALVALTTVFPSFAAEVAMGKCFSFVYPEGWTIAGRGDDGIKILSPIDSSNFLGVSIKRVDDTPPGDEEAFLEILAADLKGVLEGQLGGFSSRGGKVVTMGGRRFATLDFDFTGPDGRLRGTQASFVDRVFLVGFFLSSRPDDWSDQRQSVLGRAVDSFVFSRDAKAFLEGLKAYDAAKYAKAIEHFDKALTLWDGMSDYWYYKGLALQADQGFDRIEESSRCFATAATLDNTHAAALSQLGMCHAATGDLEGALAILGDAIAIDPANVEARLYRCKLLVNAKRGDEALSAAEEVLAIDPSNQEATQIHGKLIELREQAYGNR